MHVLMLTVLILQGKTTVHFLGAIQMILSRKIKMLSPQKLMEMVKQYLVAGDTVLPNVATVEVHLLLVRGAITGLVDTIAF